MDCELWQEMKQIELTQYFWELNEKKSSINEGIEAKQFPKFETC